jgi:hypothetical protein
MCDERAGPATQSGSRARELQQPTVAVCERRWWDRDSKVESVAGMLSSLSEKPGAIGDRDTGVHPACARHTLPRWSAHRPPRRSGSSRVSGPVTCWPSAPSHSPQSSKNGGTGRIPSASTKAIRSGTVDDTAPSEASIRVSTVTKVALPKPRGTIPSPPNGRQRTASTNARHARRPAAASATDFEASVLPEAWSVHWPP